jgi:UDP-glucuronate 4-epimerase
VLVSLAAIWPNRLLADGHKVTVIDNFDPFYDERVKLSNIAETSRSQNYQLISGDIANISEFCGILQRNYDAIVAFGRQAWRPAIN